jgi:hypothetical protein
MKWPGRWAEGFTLGLLVEWFKGTSLYALVFTGATTGGALAWGWLSQYPPLFVFLIALGTCAISLLLVNEWRRLRQPASPPPPAGVATVDDSARIKRAREEQRLERIRILESYSSEGRDLQRRLGEDPRRRSAGLPTRADVALLQQDERDVIIWRDKVATLLWNISRGEGDYFLNCPDAMRRVERMECFLTRLQTIIDRLRAAGT